MRRAGCDYGLAAAALAALVAAASGANAADWTITPSISGEQAYSDNVDLDEGSAGTADFSTTIAPRLRVDADGNRLDLTFDYEVSRITFWENGNLDEFRHTLSARADVEVVPDVLFLDAESAIREEFIDNTGAVSGGNANANNNRGAVQTHNISPSIRHRFGSFADLELRYRFSTSLVESGADDSVTQTATLGLASGNQFRTFQWDFDATGSTRDTTGGSSGGGAAGSVSDDRLTADLNLVYPFSPKFALLGGIGYEDITDNQLDKDPVGITWSAGFRWTPSSRTSFEITYGRRFDDDNLNFSALYRIAPRLQFSANFSQTLQASDQRRSGILLPPGVIDADGDFIDDVTGLPIDLSEGGFSFNNNTTRNDAFSATLNGSSGRTTFGLTGTASQRSSDVSNTDQVVTGLSLQLGRTFDRRTTGSMSLSYRNTDFDTADGRIDELYSASASLAYRLQRDFTGSLNYTLTERDSNVATGELTENTVSIRLSKSF